MKNFSTLLIGLTTLLFISCASSGVRQVECKKSLYEEDRQQYYIWEERFSDLFPEYEVYDAGSYCLIDENKHLVTFSYFDSKNGRQMIALFDQDKSLLRVAQDIICTSAGDLPFPEISEVNDERVVIECNSGDMGFLVKEKFEVDLSTFNVTSIGREQKSVEY